MSDYTEAPRFPPLTPANGNLDAAQLTQYEYIVDITKATYGDTIITEDSDGSLQGPFNILLYTPTIVQPWVTLQLAVAALLTPIEAEAAVLGVLSVTKARYGIYAHTILAQKAGYTLAQVEAMLSGTCPPDITARQAAIYKLAVKMAHTRGPLDSGSYNDAVSVLGLDGVAGAIQQSAAFLWADVMMNTGNVGLPSGVGC